MSKTSSYRWANGARKPKGVAAEDAQAEMDRVRRKRGLTPDTLVEESRPVDAVLHGAFEWRDDVAAEQYRKQQASSLIRAVVTVETYAMPEHRTYVIVRQPEDEEADASYSPMVDVVQNPDLLSDAVRRLKSEVSSASRSVNEVVSLASAVNADPVRRGKLAAFSESFESVAKEADSLL